MTEQRLAVLRGRASADLAAGERTSSFTRRRTPHRRGRFIRGRGRNSAQGPSTASAAGA